MTADLSLDLAPPLQGSQKASLIKAVIFITLASITLLPHFLLCAVFGPIGFVGIVVATICGMILTYELAYAQLVICLFLQNLFIAIVTPEIAGLDQFTPMLATNFVNIVLVSIFGSVIWLRARKDLPSMSDSIMRMLVLFFVVILVYTGVGAARSTLSDALTYTRVYMVGGLMLTIGVAFGLKIHSSYAVSVLRVITFFLVLWGFLEFFSTYWLYDTFHIADYMRLKYAADVRNTFYSIEETINFASRSYLNLSGALGLEYDILRPMGPNVHPISYAYGLAFAALVCYIYFSPTLLVGCLTLLALVGAKGPLLMAFLSVALGLQYQFFRNRRALLISLLTIMIGYIVVGLAYGSYTEDYHVIGFWGGVKGFMSNPLGNGVGIGGNLSALGSQKVNFSLFQGYGASFALESGFGVMLYQIGICTGVFLLLYWRVWSNVWKATKYFATEPRLVALPCALGILLVNSIFQEEAFSPAGWGPLLMLSGLLLAKYWREIGPNRSEDLSLTAAP
jgi:hypothetical protein